MLHESSGAIARQSNSGTAEIRSEKFRDLRRRKFFRVVAKHAFPKKTVPAVRALTGAPERTIYDWMRGITDAPWGVYVALLREIDQA